MGQLFAGFARVDITPMMGIGVAGYYQTRLAEGVLDELEINALALDCGGARAVLLSVDNCGLKKDFTDRCRERIAEDTGLSRDAIFIHSTHTHTGPLLESGNTLAEEYAQMLCRRASDAVRFALEDRKPARMGYAVGQAPHIAFIRRYRMKDGSIRTNPGVNNPNILEPIGTTDERVNVLRFDQEGGKSLVLVNFGCHPDVVGGCRISADWPGFLRRTVEQALDNTRCIFFNGAEGDVNHVNVRPTGGDGNDLTPDFDDVDRGYGHARHMGRVVAGAVLQIFDKVKYTQADTLRFAQNTIQVPSNRPSPEEIKSARTIHALHQAGKDEEIPYKGMMLTTVVAKAQRVLNLEHGPNAFPMDLSAVAIGPVALLGIPGEPFTGIGRAVKEAEGWELVLPCCITNGQEGYFPMREAYDEGGYEAGSSPFQAGVAELIIDEGKALLGRLR